MVGGRHPLGCPALTAERAFDWLARHAERTPDRVALIDQPSGRRLSYGQFHDRASRLATSLRGWGVGSGDRVAVLTPNRGEVFEVEFACWRLGAVMVPVNWRLAIPEMRFITADSTPTVLLYDPELAAEAAQLEVPARVAFGPELEAAIEGAGMLPDPVEARLDDVLTILYTAGTTGRPKGALITHRMTLFNAVNITAAARLTSDSVHLTVLPLFHTGGLNLLANPCFHLGATVVVQRAFDPDRTLALLADRDLGVTHFFGVPANYLFMAQAAAFPATELRQLVYAGVGGAPAPLPLLEAWIAKGCALTQGWGMTETGPTGLVIGPDRVLDKVGSAGLPAVHVEARVVDAGGEEVPRGAVGELWVRGPGVTPGYFRRPEATAEAFAPGGWLKTGDAARQDSDGYFYIVDRWKDMYISGGENVYPAEVESAIHELPEVAEAAVIGVPDPRWGESGLALVVLRPGAALGAEAVLEHCRSRVARFKVPRAVRFLDQPLPRNAAGKVLKRDLKEVHR